MLSQASMQNSEYKETQGLKYFPQKEIFENAAQNKRNLEA